MKRPYLWLFCLLLVAGCAHKRQLREARQASESFHWDQAYQLWSDILLENPTNTRAKIQRERARMQAALAHLRKATFYLEREKFEEAAFETGLVMSLDPQNSEALRLRAQIKEKYAAKQAELNQKEKAKTAEAFSNVPVLKPNTWGPQNIYFPKPTPVRDIYTAIGRAYGINILVDPKIRNEKLSLDLRNLNFLKALDTLMVLNRHFFKVMDTNTLIIMEDSKQNRERYDNQIIRTFYLSNITPKDLKAHLRQLSLKEFAENERLNAITIKGTPEQLVLAEKIITANDKSQPEVIVEIELLEVNKNHLQRLGMMPVGPDGSPNYRAGLIADPRDRNDDDRDSGGIRGIFPSLNSDDFLTIVPAIAVDFLKENGDSKQVSNPNLRVTSGETANISIGQSIPIANTSFTNAQLSGSSAGSNNFGDQALTTFNYNDVGIRIEVTPRVHFNQEVTLVLKLEISSVVTGGLQPVLGKREVETTIRLKNGETNVLAGLLTNTERKSLSGIPGLADIPILGRLFSNDEKTISQTDIIMTLRPNIVRSADITSEDRAAYEISDLRLSSLYDEAAREGLARENQGGNPVQNPPAPGETNPFPGQAPADGANPQPGNVPFDPGAPSATIPQGRTPFDPGAKATPNPAGTIETQPEDEDISDDPFAESSLETAPAMLAFTPNILVVRQDDLLEYQLFLTNVNNLRKGRITLVYDKEVLQAESVEPGNFFDARGNRPLLTPAWNNQTGRVSMILTQRRGEEPFSGSGILAQIRFRAKSPGKGQLRFATLVFEDGEGRSIAADGLDASYEVSP